MPRYLQRMALFKVNTGCREQEVCGLRWDWEVKVPEFDTSVFIIPDAQVKNGNERLVVLNEVARSVIVGQRGIDPVFVSPYRRHRVTRMHNTAWKRSRELAAQKYPKVFGRDCPEGWRNIRVHDLKHTFGRSLRATGYHLRIARICRDTSRDVSPRTTRRWNCRISSMPPTGCVKRGPVMVLLRSAQHSGRNHNRLILIGNLVAPGGLEPPTPAL